MCMENTRRQCVWSHSRLWDIWGCERSHRDSIWTRWWNLRRRNDDGFLSRAFLWMTQPLAMFQANPHRQWFRIHWVSMIASTKHGNKCLYDVFETATHVMLSNSYCSTMLPRKRATTPDWIWQLTWSIFKFFPILILLSCEDSSRLTIYCIHHTSS